MSLRTRRIPLALVVALLGLAVFPVLARADFQIGMEDGHFNGGGNDAGVAPYYQLTQTLGASTLRIVVNWSVMAGPTAFDQTNVNAPQYKWKPLDQAIRRAAQYHLRVMFMVFGAPLWAEGPNYPVGSPNVQPGGWEPNPTLFGQFIHTLAERYSGSFPDPLNIGAALPRVQYYQLWNEPNLGGYVAGPDQVGQWRNLENAGYAAIKSVNPSNVAVLAGLAPIAPLGIYSRHPLTDARALLCIRLVGKKYRRIKGCPRVNFDIMAVHPYSLAATPTKPPVNPNDILVQDVYKLHDALVAAEKLHTIAPGRHPLWNTEWVWFTNPPQAAYGDPPNVAARYVAYSMYEMWKAGVSMVIWPDIHDVISSPNPGGGLETNDGVPKPTMTAFSFPFIASVKGHKGYAWGRTPLRHAAKVFVQHQVHGQWRRVATVNTDGFGVFQAHFKARGNGTYRAQVQRGQFSLPYFSAKIPPRRTHPYTFG